MSTIVTADKGEIETYKPNEVFDLSIHLTNKTGEVLGANCSVQIRNDTLELKENLMMNEIGEGWYNATYNTSTVGKYFCRQNCTKGAKYVAGTCDFIIGGEQEMLFAAIVLIPLFITIFLIVLAIMIPKEYWALKVALPIMGAFFIFTAYQYGAMAIAKFYNFTELIDAIGESSYIFGWILWVLIAIILIGVVYYIFMLFDKKKHKTGDYND